MDAPEKEPEDIGAELSGGSIPAPQPNEQEPLRFPAPPSTVFIQETVGIVSELNRQGLIRQMVRYAAVVPLVFVVSFPRLLVRRLRPGWRR